MSCDMKTVESHWFKTTNTLATGINSSKVKIQRQKAM